MRGAAPPINTLFNSVAALLLSLILLNLTFYPWRQESLIWTALVPLLVWLADPTRFRRHIFLGLFLVGALYHFNLLVPFLSIGWWGWGATSAQGVQDYFTSAHLFMGSTILLIAVWGGVVLGLIGMFLRPFLANPWTAVWIVPSAWVFLLEYLGHRSIFAFSWGLIGNRLHGQTVIRQAASAFGVYGLSFIVVMVNALLASWVIEWNARNTQPPSSRRSSVGRRGNGVSIAMVGATLSVAMVVGASVLYGVSRLRGMTERASGIPVALLQAARKDYAMEDFTSEGLDRLYGGMLEQAITHGAKLIVLPESVWLKTLQLDDTTNRWIINGVSVAEMHRALMHTLRASPAVVAFGIDAVGGGRTYNVTTFWDQSGLLGVYRKRKLVPFSEYQPALIGRWAPHNRIHGEQFAFTQGDGSQLIHWGSVTLGPFICQEVMFPSLVRQTVRDGAQLLVTTGNDGVFTSPIVAWEQFNLAQLRAVETGRYLIRAMKTGISAILDPCGRVLAEAPLNAQAIIDGRVYPREEWTGYTRWGNWVVWLSAFIVAVAVAGYLIRRSV